VAEELPIDPLVREKNGCFEKEEQKGGGGTSVCRAKRGVIGGGLVPALGL